MPNANIITNQLVANSGQGLPAQDFIIIGGVISPGKCTVTGAHRASDIQKRKGWGLTGATSVPMGDDLAVATLHFEFWEDAQMTLGGPTPGSIGWYLFFNNFFSHVGFLVPGGILPTAIGIGHPVLSQLTVNAWLIKDRGGMEKDEYGLWTQDIHIEEYRRPLPAPQKPIAAIPAVNAPVPTAQDADDKSIEVLSAARQGLADGLI